MSDRARLGAAIVFSALALTLGVLAAWPIYETAWLLVTAAAALVLGVGVAAVTARRLGVLASFVVLFAVFVITVVPVAVPSGLQQFPSQFFPSLIDAVAATVLGFKQLLTITLPAGSYLTVLVPAYEVFLLTSFLTTTLALRSRKWAPLAAGSLLFGVAFGTAFGASAASAPITVGVLTIAAPRETALWLAAAVLGASWVWLFAGAERRAALRRGRSPQLGQHPDQDVFALTGTAAEQPARGTGRRLNRLLLGVAVMVLALLIAAIVAPLAATGSREVLRDRVDPLLVLSNQPSPLASYRAFKTNDAIDEVLFTVSADGQLPSRIRLAVLEHYNGVDFTVGESEASRFTRFASAPRIAESSDVEVSIGEGYSWVWAPIAELGSVPRFTGARADQLADAFFVNRQAVAAIVAPPGVDGSQTSGLQPGDGFSAEMSVAPLVALEAAPVSSSALFDVESTPEMAKWIDTQQQPATAAGFAELVNRLRERGYLSHSLTATGGEQLWLQRLAEQHGTTFEPSPGGHSIARVEQLFAQLNAQQQLAGENASDESLVAAIGDDEQFATAVALIARSLGYESRVVLGARMDGVGSEEVPGVASCLGSCTGQNLAAWVEVRGADGVWATVDATPQVSVKPMALEEGEQLPEFATTPEERDAREVEPPLGFGERNDAADDADVLAAPTWLLAVLRVIGLSLFTLLLIAAPFAFIPLAKRRRNRKRRAEPNPELSALGAWQSMIDDATDTGAALPLQSSRADIASALGTTPAAWAAATVDRAVFSSWGIRPEDAQWMWAAADADHAERHARLTRTGRLRALFSLRSFGVNASFLRQHAKESAVSDARNTRTKELSDAGR